MGSTRSATGGVRRLSESAAAAVPFVRRACLFAMGAFGERERFLPARHGGTGDSSSELSRDMELAGRERSLIIRIEPNGLRNKNQRTGGCGSEGISQSVTQSKAAWMQGPAHVTQPAHNKTPGRRRDDRRILVLVGVDLELDVYLSLELIWIWIGSGLTRTHSMQFVFFLWVQLT